MTATIAKPFASIESGKAAETLRKVPSSSKVAYLVSRFPKLTETFVLYEVLAVEETGQHIELYPLQRERTKTMHPEAAEVVRRARFTPWISWSCLLAHGWFLTRRPKAYFRALGRLLWANLGSARYFAGAVCFFPKAVLIARQLELSGVGHIHAHFASHPAAVAFVIHRLTGIPYSFTAHGSDLHRDRHMLREKVAEAKFVVAVSEYNRRLIAGECGAHAADRIRVLHCGVDTRVFKPREASHRPAAGTFEILCVGALHEVKGQTYLLEACRTLRERGLPVVCHLVGDGPDRRALERQAEAAGIAPFVRFHGRLKRQDVADLLARVDVAVTPSVPTADGRREGIPVALMEALACGLPTVASDLSGIPELIEHERSGLLVAPRDASGLAAALERLRVDPALALRLGSAGRRRVVEAFDLRMNAQALAALFPRGERA